MAGVSRLFPNTGVWWDLNTCPVPSDFPPGCVRPCIESALLKFHGIRPVTIFAVGDLESFDRDLLNEISSSGILIIHTPFGGNSLSWLLSQWKRRNPTQDKILLISGDNSWFCDEWPGYSVIRAIPKCLPSFINQPCVKKGDWRFAVEEWDWETLLQKNVMTVVESMLVKEDEPAWFCDLCEIASVDCDTFIEHLKGEEHKLELANSVPLKKNGEPWYFCQYCPYTAYDSFCLDIHCNSCEHKPNEAEKKKKIAKSHGFLFFSVILLSLMVKCGFYFILW